MANNQKNNRTNNLVVPSFAQAVNQMKQEIAQEFDIQLGPDTTARANGSVGGEITKRLVALAEQQLGGHKK
ncbi:alpha/beta-type small acid-soluble spore protein [Priestia megaterium]|uniref:alpha/beta-type small acid-soluble spore protein n=1 Tax=Priestia megaterium TaxID=1404 RepID=UPI0021ABAAF9|nr:alpha/beta-type small acid-soluble spore protein [Priestia megaterium]MCR8928858.1 alpha/beta-type small acid-soluble spore protein [Priestia megaterium]